MASVEEMKLVFRLGGVGFALSIRQLLEIAEPESGGDGVEDTAAFYHRGDRIPLRNLRQRLNLGPRKDAAPGLILVLVGADGPWGVRVDAVAGMHPAGEFLPRPAPFWMFRPGAWPFRQLLLWHGEPLVLVDPLGLEAHWDIT